MLRRGWRYCCIGFNSRSRVGSDPVRRLIPPNQNVSIRAPAWGATEVTATFLRYLKVSIRAPAWGATHHIGARQVQHIGFNSRSRVGSDRAGGCILFEIIVSIRAPAWGATFGQDFLQVFESVSIRAPAWGATRYTIQPGDGLNVSIRAPAWGATYGGMDKTPVRFGFNSRSRVGSDRARCRCRRRMPGFNSRSRVGSDDHAALAILPNDVSIRAPAWGATLCRRRRRRRRPFQFALPRGERRTRTAAWTLRALFQFALPRGERLAQHRTAFGMGAVSIRAPAWGATPTLTTCWRWIAFQFALPRGERRLHPSPTRTDCRVSIRAPAWGATPAARDFPPAPAVSIRAPAWGATFGAVRKGFRVKVSIRAPAWGATASSATTLPRMKFQFALPRGERRSILEGMGGEPDVSIRAPAWGATSQGRQLPKQQPCFNSRSRVGSDVWILRAVQPSAQFQFALPRGERLEHGVVVLFARRFQFALPRGERRGRRGFPHCRQAFQFALPRGERHGQRAIFFLQLHVSIRAPAWGATSSRALVLSASAFQFALPRGERPSERNKYDNWNKFQFALPRGERQRHITNTFPKHCFNSRSRVGSDGWCDYLPQPQIVSIRAPAWGATQPKQKY